MRALALLFCPLLALGCAAAHDDASTGSNDSDVDTSGCSGGTDLQAADGPFTVVATRPPRKSCWNLPSAGLSVTYAWTQSNDATPRKDNVGFWASINGAGIYAKADAYRCEEIPAGGYGHPTDNQRSYRCSASKLFTFQAAPKLLEQAYQSSGERRGWDVETAASLDDNGTWDSRGGANYRFAF